MFGLRLPLTCKPWTTLSNPCNKVRGIYFVKEIFLRLPSCVYVTASFITASLSLRLFNYCVVVMLNEHVYVYISIFIIWVYNVWFGACASRVLQGFRTNLVTVNDSFKHPNTTSTKRDKEKWWNRKKWKEKKQEQTSNNKRNGPARKEQKEKKKRGKQCNALEEKKKKQRRKNVSGLQHSYNFYLSLSFNLGSKKKKDLKWL